MLLNWLIRKEQTQQKQQQQLCTDSSASSGPNPNDISFLHEQQQQQREMFELCPPNGEQSVRQLILLNISCLPVNYGTNPRSTHYKRVARNRLAANGPDNGDECDTSFWTMMAYCSHANDNNGRNECAPLLVGAITVSCRNRNCCSCSSSNSFFCCNCSSQNGGGEKQLFAVQILTLAVLPTFRRHGVAARLLNSLIRQCEEWSNVEKIFLHCQTSNEAALCLYLAHGFVAVQQIHGHYHCIRRRSIGDESTDAFLLERRIN